MSNKLRETLGREAGEDLMTWLEEERARGTRLEAAFGELRTEMRLGFAQVDKRFEMVIGEMREALAKQNTAIETQNTAIANQNGTLERGLKEQTRFFFLAWAVQLAAIVGLYAR